MRSFLTSSLVFVLIAITLALGVHRVSEALAPPFEMTKRRMAYLEEQLGELEVLGVGASHGTSIDFDALGARGFHLWMPGQDAFETTEVLRTFLPRLPRLHTVLMPVTFMSFATDNSIEVSEDRSLLRRSFYATNPSWRPIGDDYESLVAGKLASVVREDHWRGPWEELVRRLRGAEEPRGRRGIRVTFVARDGFMVRRPGAFYLEPEEQVVETEKEVARQDLFASEMAAADSTLPERAYRAVERSIELAREHGVRLILYSAPVTENYRREISDQWVSAFRASMERLVAAHGVEYYDFSEDPEFVQRWKFFFDPHHLNRPGAEAFTRARLRPLLEAGVSKAE